jgi:hypothetical protein
MSTDPTSDTHAQHVPAEFIPEGYTQITNYTEEDLPALAEEIAADTDEPAGKIFGMLEGLVNGYNIPIARAERSARIQYGEKEPRVIEDPDLPKKYGWER